MLVKHYIFPSARETDNGIEPVDPNWPREGHGGGIDGKTGL